MNPLSALAALVLLLALPSAHADDASDAPAAAPPAAAFRWRADPSGTGKLPGPPPRGSLRDFKAALAAHPEGPAKSALAAVVDELAAAAASIPAEERDAWIDGHLGALNQAVRDLPKNAPRSLAAGAAAGAARLNNAAERWQEGRELASLALDIDSDDAEALVQRSRANSALGDFARAYADADAALRRSMSWEGAWTARAAASYGLGNYLQAVDDARRALAADPDDKTAHALMRLSEGRSGADPRFENAGLAQSIEREYHGMAQQLGQVEALRRSPFEEPSKRGVRSLVEAAGAKLAAKDYHGALEESDKALELQPDDLRALFFRAAAENLLGRYSDAERDASRGLALQPSAWFLRDARAWARIRMGRFAEAIADANRSLEMDARNPYALANRGHAYEGRGDLRAMASDLKAAAELDPRFETDYRDSTRRHGLNPDRLAREGKALLPSWIRTARIRSYGVLTLLVFAGSGLVVLGVARMLRGGRSGIEARYKIGKAIGQGGMGVVYEALDRRLRRPVAIKMLRDELLLDAAARKSLVEEATTVAELRHPSIVEIHAIEQDDRGLYLVFERLAGRTLDELLAERKRLPLPEIKRVLGAVCSALAYAHAHDVVHRDLKPANVMLTEDGGVKVLDFGISRHAALRSAAPTTLTVVGTPHYMAPEQEYGVIRRENDVFGLGAVLYEMATGERPFEGPTPAKLAKIYRRPSERAPELGSELDALIDGALEPDPDKRIPTPERFWEMLAAVSETPARG